MTALALLLTLAAAPTDLEARRLIVERFERAGRSGPADDGPLDKAAADLAQRALDGAAADAASMFPLTRALSRAGGWDPQPTTIVLKAGAKDLLPLLGKRDDLAADPCSHLGVGLALRGEEGALVVLLARRKLELEPVARSFKKPPRPQRVCATLVPPLDRAELFVTRPDGAVERQDLARSGEALCATLELPSVGRHTVELLGNGPRGPEVGALFFVTVGHDPGREDEAEKEPATAPEARALILSRTNALRRGMGLPPLATDAVLEAVAQRYAERMAKEGFFAHVAPDGSDLKSRLTAEGYRYLAAGENLGNASGPLAAHFGIEHSPGHRKNLLEPNHRKLGIGIAPVEDGQWLLVEVLASPADDGGDDPLGAAYKAINQARGQRKLPALKRSPVLEALALEHVKKALQLDTPKVDLPGVPRLHERAFEVVDAKSVAVDVYVTSSPALAIESKNLADPANALVGVGLVRGSSERWGQDKFWVIVIYATVPRATR